MQIGAARGPGLASLATKQSTNFDCTNKYFKAGDNHELQCTTAKLAAFFTSP